MHLDMSLPSGIMNGASRSIHWDVEVVQSDGGNEVRNSRWSSPLRAWEISYNNAQLDSDDHAAVLDLWIASEGGNHTFNWEDERTGETVMVRFDDDLTFSHTAGPFHKIESFRIVEVRQ